MTQVSVRSSDMPRVLFVTPRYLPFTGGVQNHVYEVSRRLARMGVETTILTTNPGGQLPVKETIDGVMVRRVRAWPSNRDYYFAPGVDRIIVEGTWDIVHVQSYHTLVAPLAMFSAWRAGIPYVVTFHGGGHSSSLRNALRGLQRRLLRPLLARAARLVAIAGFEVAHFSEELAIPADRFVFIPNGADLPGPPEGELPGVDDGLLVSIGRLERYKGHHRVIEALPTVMAERPDTRLWIAGNGSYEPRLTTLARQLGIEDRVAIHAIPPTQRERMARELSKAALVVAFSEYETHPIAVLEALALGRPALVADTSGLRELADRGLVRALPLHSTPQQIGRAILEELSRPQVVSTVRLPTWDDCAAGLLALYRGMMEPSQCAS